MQEVQKHSSRWLQAGLSHFLQEEEAKQPQKMPSALHIALPSSAVPGPLIPLQILPYFPSFLLASPPALRVAKLLQANMHTPWPLPQLSH